MMGNLIIKLNHDVPKEVFTDIFLDYNDNLFLLHTILYINLITSLPLLDDIDIFYFD